MTSPLLTYPKWLARRRRRERLLMAVAVVAAIALPSLLAWVTVAWWLS